MSYASGSLEAHHGSFHCLYVTLVLTYKVSSMIYQ